MSNAVKISFTTNEEYIIKEAKCYASDVELVEKMIRESKPYRYCLLDSYREFLRLKQIIPIEELEDETKKGLYETSLKFIPEKIHETERRSLCRILWLFNFVFEKYFL